MGKIKKQEASIETEEKPEAIFTSDKVEFIAGELRDWILTRIQEIDRPWDKLKEAEQRDLSRTLGSKAKEVIMTVANRIAARGFPVINAEVESVTVKDGIKAALTLSRFSDQRHKLVDAQGQSVLLVVSDAKVFLGEKNAVEIDPDQKDLPGFDQTKSGKRMDAEQAEAA
ncbi:hypothetical protein UFOVP413_46 [uncultured Caudovirales phage]|uniref:Uncharacterized protein n=1 Tax=uncultured Caudovirales phage TaxID=2100421 RepID=A0A6J5M2W5_9CAUD|nr:hypothetical protein UFOVP413_46 [uncultured Caudovirales phage]